MTVAPKIRAALEAAREAFTAIIAEAPEKEPELRHYRSQQDEWTYDAVSWDRAETARPALQQVNAALAEMEAQS